MSVFKWQPISELGKPQKSSSTNSQAIKRGGGKGRAIMETFFWGLK